MIQNQVINKIIKDKDSSLILLNNLTDEFFCDYTKEFNFIKEHLDKYGNVPDIYTFLEKFPEFDVVEVNETSRYLIDRLYEDKNKRSIASTFNKVRELLIKNKVDEAMRLYVSATDNVLTSNSIQCVDIVHDISRYDKYVEKCNDYNKYYIKTGFKELDELIGGWDTQEELATIVARSGVGKSWCMLKSAVAALEQGLTVGIYSGEMSETKVGYRIDTLLGHFSNGAIIHGKEEIQNEYKKYLENLRKNYKGTIKVLTPAMINGAAGVTALRAFVEKEKLDVLFIDQHSLLEDDRHGKSPTEKASNISRDLKNLQVLKKIPIIAVSQQNREKNEDGATLANIAMADRIGQDSTVVIFLEQKDGVMSLNLVKSRDTASGKKLQYNVDLNRGIFEYIPTESDGLDGKSCEDLRKEFEGEDEEMPF